MQQRVFAVPTDEPLQLYEAKILLRVGTEDDSVSGYG